MGVIAPVELLIESPAVEEKTPPVVPVSVTPWGVASDMQKGEPAYEIVAAGNVVMVIGLVAVTCAQPPDAAMVLVTV